MREACAMHYFAHAQQTRPAPPAQLFRTRNHKQRHTREDENTTELKKN
eukprot:gene3774-2665_t